MGRKIGRRVSRATRRKLDKFDIKAEVGRLGLTLTDIALNAGLEPSACRTALKRRNIGGELALANALGLKASDLFPDRYHACEPISATGDEPESSLIGAGLQTGADEPRAAA